MEWKQEIHLSFLKKQMRIVSQTIITNLIRGENIDTKEDTLIFCYQSQKINLVCLSKK